MKVRQDPPATPGYNGKQGGERFRTILKYPTAMDMAMKRYRAMILPYGAGGEPGRGEIPMDPIRYRASDDFPIVHIRVSSKDQNEDRQLVAMWNKVYR